MGHCLIKGQISFVFRKNDIEMHNVSTLGIYQYDMSIKIIYQTEHNSSFDLNYVPFLLKQGPKMCQ